MFRTIPFQFPQSKDGQYICILDNAGVLRSRREQLGLSQQQVAKLAHVQFSTYQRLESGVRDISGCSMKTGLSICTVLYLDPMELVSMQIYPPDLSSMKSQKAFDASIQPEHLLPKRVGRKQIRRDIMTVYVNCDPYSLIIPYEVFDKIGNPRFIEFLWHSKERRIVFHATKGQTKNSLDIPKEEFEHSLFALPRIICKNNPIAAMNWGDTPHAVEARLVQDMNGIPFILIDLNTGKPIAAEVIEGVFETPSCLKSY